ncbi:MAG: ROK family protein [Minisyncoccales bacterium]
MKNQLAIAIDFGATNLRAALISKEGKILNKREEKTIKKGESGKIVTQQIINLINFLINKEKSSKNDFFGIGISSIGPLDYQKGGPLNAPNVPFKFIPLTTPLKNHFSLPVFLLNDCNAAVLGEKYFGDGKNIENLIYITISTGIGGGAIINEKLLLGKSGNAAEVGHFIVDTKYDLPCTCGKGKGHWEGYCSGRNLPRFLKLWAKKEKRAVNFKVKESKDIFEAAKRKNKTALMFLDEVSKINAAAVSNIIVAYDPTLITIGGSVVLSNQEIILKGIKKYVDHYLKVPKIKITRLGKEITLLGAAAAVFWPIK